jgi:hypothetical protein
VTEALWLVLGIGAFAGFYLGRRSAENRRARHDMGKAWDGRRGYRDR